MDDKIDTLRLPILPTRTIYQPYASAIFSGRKWYETASRRTHIRGRIYIHAASTLPPRIYVPFLLSAANLPYSNRYTLEWLHSLPIGAILGTVQIIDCVPVEDIRGRLTATGLAFGDYGDGRWAYKLANPIAYPRPIPAKGKQGWWRFGEKEQLEIHGVDDCSVAADPRHNPTLPPYVDGCSVAADPKHIQALQPPPRTAHEFSIRMFQMGAVVRELLPASMAEAKREYVIGCGLASQYTQLVVDGRELTTSEARRFLKLRKYG